jgi:hypothetical protein
LDPQELLPRQIVNQPLSDQTKAGNPSQYEGGPKAVEESPLIFQLKNEQVSNDDDTVKQQVHLKGQSIFEYVEEKAKSFWKRSV